MGEPVVIFAGTTGENDIVDPVRLKINFETGIAELAEAVNVLIDQTGLPYRRPGQTLVSAGDYHSIFCDGGDCFVILETVDYSTIYRLNADKTLTAIQPGLAKGKRYGWLQVGSKTYWSNGVEKGVIVNGVSLSWAAQTYAGPPTSRNFEGPPAGTHLALFGSSICVVNGPIVRISEPLGYGLFDRARSRVRFSSDVKLYKPVTAGVFASDSKYTYFLEGSNPNDLARRKILDCPAHEYSEATGYIEGEEFGLDGAGPCAVWSCDKGLCIGTSTGQLLVATEDKKIYPKGTVGASLIHGKFIINAVHEAQQCCVTNLVGMAPSRFTNFNFNSFANFNGSQFAAGPTGLYEVCTGEKDAGLNINAHITTGSTDFGVQNSKRLRHLYLGVNTSAKIRIIITVDKRIARTIDVSPSRIGTQRIRVSVGRDTKGGYWSFRVENVNGGALSLYSMGVLPIVLHSGRDY